MLATRSYHTDMVRSGHSVNPFSTARRGSRRHKKFSKIFGINWRWLRCGHYLVSRPRWWQRRCILPLWCPTLRNSNNMLSTPTLFTLTLALMKTRGKSFQSEISSAFSFYARDLNLVSKCRQMKKLYCEIIKNNGKYGGKKMKYLELKSPIQ